MKHLVNDNVTDVTEFTVTESWLFESVERKALSITKFQLELVKAILEL